MINKNEVEFFIKKLETLTLTIRKTMFQTFTHTGVDAIQTAKKTFVSTFVQNEQLKNILNDFVDAQSVYTKSAIDAGIKVSTDIGGVLTDRTPFVELSEKFAQYFPVAKTTKKGK